MADDIAQWLEGLGLAQHAQTFVETDIDLDGLSRLRAVAWRDFVATMWSGTIG